MSPCDADPHCICSLSLSAADSVSSALRKTSVILDALASAAAPDAPLTYYALDLEERELRRTLDELDGSIGKILDGKVATRGLAGTFDDGIRWVREGGLGGALPTPLAARPAHASLAESAESEPDGNAAPVHFMFLGSSLGNFARGADAAFLRALPLRAGAGDTLLLGLDHDNDAGAIEAAYNDPAGYTAKFIFNGLRAAGRELGDEHAFDEEKWEYVNRYDKEHSGSNAPPAISEH
jgi:uncharacterized SAM-dependent methyltransferase